MAFPSHSLLLVLPLLFNLSVGVSEGLVPRPFPFLSCHPYSLSCTQPNPIQTHVLLSPKFLMPVLTFFLNSRLVYLAYQLSNSLRGISYLVLPHPISSLGFLIFLLSNSTKKPRSHLWFLSFCLSSHFLQSYNLQVTDSSVKHNLNLLMSSFLCRWPYYKLLSTCLSAYIINSLQSIL